MPDITNPVGEGGANQSHDVAIVQLMLRLAKNAKQQPYLSTPYTGAYDAATKNAIITFQTDKNLVPATPQAAPLADKKGYIGPGSATLKSLAAMLPPTHKDVTIIPNTKTVYLADNQLNMTMSQAKIVGDPLIEPHFRQKVAALVQKMYQRHKVVLWLSSTGNRRTFAQQASITKTHSGPGESNHNFGRAVDIGFRGLRWVDGDGNIIVDDDWLNRLDAAAAKAGEPAKVSAFWNNRDKVALQDLALHRLKFERIHVQAFDQGHLSSGRSLAHLLTAVGAMKWDAHHVAKAWTYKADLGLGHKLYDVGSAKDIWAGNAHVTKAMIADAKSHSTKKAWKEADITAEDLSDARTALKTEFEKADKNWQKWTPIK